ncbi:MAG: type III secretion protein [Clostridia bacterium]|nr:type III secretion protein [Clostridia bacterium]
MIDWNDLTLFLYILMRMSGFILFNPIFGRNNIPGYFKAAMVLLLAVSVNSMYAGSVETPSTIIELSLRLILELGLGFVVAIIMQIFFYIPQQAGEVVDTQMGMSMAKTYDSGSHASMTSTATLLHLLMMFLFFAANGHITLLSIMMTSGDIVPYGAASLGDAIANRVMELFIECTILAVKLCLPILAAELLGQIGMGILMKVIPQINVFAINIELKVIVGMVMLLLLIAPFSQFLLSVESTMLTEIEQALSLTG